MTDTTNAQGTQQGGAVADRFQHLTQRYYQADQQLGQVAHDNAAARSAVTDLLQAAVELGRMGCTQGTDGRWHLSE